MTTKAIEEPVELLLVEDNPGDVRLIQEAFSEIDTQTSFYTAVDGEEALSFLQKHRQSDSPANPELMLLDLNLPQTDGFEVLREIRDNAEYPPLPTLVLTSSKAQEDISKCYQMAANAYLSKPSEPDEFVSLAQAIEAFWIYEAQLPPISSQ